MKNLLLFFTSILLLIACQFSPEEQGTTATDVVQQELETESVTSVRPKPTRFVGDVPVYQTFEDIAPLFKIDTDTTYVINFWATWCKPCVEELPYFEKIVNEYKNEKIQVILVSLDFEKQLESKLLPFLKEQNLKSEVVVLADGNYNNWIDKVDPDWGGAIPATIIYNAKDRKFFGEQFADFNELEELVKELM